MKRIRIDYCRNTGFTSKNIEPVEKAKIVRNKFADKILAQLNTFFKSQNVRTFLRNQIVAFCLPLRFNHKTGIKSLLRYEFVVGLALQNFSTSLHCVTRCPTRKLIPAIRLKIQRTPGIFFKLSDEQLTRAQESLSKVLAELNKILLGNDEVHRMLLVGILAKGHVLLEGQPGVGKTTLAKSLGQLLNLQFKRVQFTPDLMPNDILGAHILQQKAGEEGHVDREMVFPAGTDFLQTFCWLMKSIEHRLKHSLLCSKPCRNEV